MSVGGMLKMTRIFQKNVQFNYQWAVLSHLSSEIIVILFLVGWVNRENSLILKPWIAKLSSQWSFSAVYVYGAEYSQSYAFLQKKFEWLSVLETGLFFPFARRL